MKDKRTRIDVRCSVKEKKLLMDLARARGMTASELIREMIFGRKVTVRYRDIGKGQKEIIEV